MNKNILFIMTDQHNPNYVGYSGRGLVDTPNIDFISKGISFKTAVSTNPVCTPARCSLLTGKYPHQVGMMTMSGCLNTNYPTYAKALQEKGYYTAAIGKLHYLQGWHWYAARGGGHNLIELENEQKKYGFDFIWEAAGKGLMLKNYCNYAQYLEKKGFLEAYRDEIDRRAIIGHPEYPDNSESFGISEKDHVEYVITDQVINQIKNRDKQKPFSVFCSYLSPHPMIDPPKRYMDRIKDEDIDKKFTVLDGKEPLGEDLRERWINNRKGYRALIEFVDDQIARILQLLREEDILDDTLIIFTSDHGDMLGNYGWIGKCQPWDESVTVPLAIRHPSFLNGKCCENPVSIIDVTATILDFAEINYKNELALAWPAWNDVVPCRSLMPIIKGETDSIREFTYTESDSWDMIATKNFRYVRYRQATEEFSQPIEELIDLKDKQNEWVNVIDDKKYANELKWLRDRWAYTISSTPAGQMGWAKVEDEEFAFIKPDQFKRNIEKYNNTLLKYKNSK